MYFHFHSDLEKKYTVGKIDRICINCWLPVYKKSILEKQVASKINGVV